MEIRTLELACVVAKKVKPGAERLYALRIHGGTALGQESLGKKKTLRSRDSMPFSLLATQISFP